MLAIKKLVTLSPALTLTILGPVLFNGCSPSGPRALLQGERLLRDGKYAQAVQKLELAAQLLPKDARAWNHLGLAYHDAGRPGDAGKAYQQALALDRNLAAAHYNLGCLHFDQNNIPAAVTELTSYTGLQPNAPEGWTKLGAAQLRARQLDVAEKNLRQALKLDPHLPEAWNGLGLVQTQRRHYPEAYQHFYAAWREQRDYAPALLNLAVVSQQYLNGRPFALQKYKEYLALKPQPPNSTAVQQIANELELELHPPARPALTNTPAQLAVLTNQPTPAVMTNKPTPASAGKSLAASATLPATTPPIRTNAATSAPPPPHHQPKPKARPCHRRKLK